MRSRSLGIDPVTGIESMFHPSSDGSTFTVESSVDIQPILERNKLLRDEIQPKGWKGEMHLVASIPWVVLENLAKRGFVTMTGKILDQKAYRNWINSSEAKPFRVKQGYV